MRASLIDSGVYHYRLNGEPAAVEERWQRHRLAGGDLRVSSSRSAPGVALTVDALVRDEQVRRFDVVWRAAGRPELRAAYSLSPQRVLVERRVGGAAAQAEELPLPPGQASPLLFPLMRIFAGPVIAQLLDNGGRGVVVLPFIADPAAQARLLRPTASEREARLVAADEELELAGAQFRCRQCQYLGDQYGTDSRFWLAGDNMLVRYRWQQAPGQDWEVWMQRDGEH